MHNAGHTRQRICGAEPCGEVHRRVVKGRLGRSAGNQEGTDDKKVGFVVGMMSH